MNKLFTLAALASILSVPLFGTFQQEKKGISLQVIPYTLHSDSDPKLLRSGKLQENNMCGVEISILNNSTTPVSIASEQISLTPISLQEIDELFGWNYKKAGCHAGITTLALTLPSPFSAPFWLASTFNPYFWKQHGFWKGLATNFTSNISAIAATNITWAPQFKECYVYAFAKGILKIFTSDTERRRQMLSEAAPACYNASYVTAPSAAIATNYGMMRHFDNQKMNKLKEKYLHEPITIQPGQMITKLVYVKSDEFKRMQLGNQSFTVSLVNPVNVLTAKFEVPAAQI